MDLNYVKLNTFFKKNSKIITVLLNSSTSGKTDVISFLNIEYFLRCCAKPRKQKINVEGGIPTLIKHELGTKEYVLCSNVLRMLVFVLTSQVLNIGTFRIARCCICVVCTMQNCHSHPI